MSCGLNLQGHAHTHARTHARTHTHTHIIYIKVTHAMHAHVGITT